MSDDTAQCFVCGLRWPLERVVYYQEVYHCFECMRLVTKGLL